MEDKDVLMRDIEFAWEEWHATKRAAELLKEGFFTPVAIEFCYYYTQKKRQEYASTAKKD